jgi:hypothetical protein
MESNPQSFSTKQTFRECPQMQGRIPPNQRASARYTPKSEGGCKTTILGGSTAVLGLLSSSRVESGRFRRFRFYRHPFRKPETFELECSQRLGGELKNYFPNPKSPHPLSVGPFGGEGQIRNRFFFRAVSFRADQLKNRFLEPPDFVPTICKIGF